MAGRWFGMMPLTLMGRSVLVLVLFALLSPVSPVRAAAPTPAASVHTATPVALSGATDESGYPEQTDDATVDARTLAGLSLLVVGIGLVIAEAFVLSFGALGLIGVIAFLVGSVLLMETGLPVFRTALPVIAATGVGLLLLLIVLVRLALKAHRARLVTGDRQLIGEIAVALDNFDGSGQARLHGEVWQVRAAGPVRQGDRLRVLARNGLTLDVEIES